MGSHCPQVPPGAAEETSSPRGTVKQQGSADGNLHCGVWSPQLPHGLLAWREGGRDAQTHADMDGRMDRGMDEC